MKLVCILTVSILCVSAQASHEDNVLEQARNILLMNEFEFNKISDGLKCNSANAYIVAGGLKGILINGASSTNFEAMTFFKSHKNSLLLIERCLKYGNTLAATPRMLNDPKYSMVNGSLCLDMSQNGLVTVRDWAPQERFKQVEILNLSYNPLNELPAEFFKLFPKLEKIKINHTEIESLFTEHMPYGLQIVAYNSNLKTITTNDLATKCLVINAINTPLAKNPKELTKIYTACKPVSQSCLARVFSCLCWCIYDEDPEDYVSVVNV